MLCWPFWCQTTLLRSRAVSSSVSAKTTFMVLVYAGKLLLPSLCALLNNYTPPTALIISVVLFLTISPPDSVERFHISAFLVSVLAQNILEAEGPWFGNFIYIQSRSHRDEGRLMAPLTYNIISIILHLHSSFLFIVLIFLPELLNSEKRQSL
ncbi:hypothetical protein F2Q69_00050727 [Brassica cretica]|uniref:Uncharacterized protein n=1 Tax=Brassica cretica TaxID=69181 RepID=A0A8S9PNY5_BRACR|nr:hypothetical protein F2Q69_00050727 [Brassica cretica]